MLNVFSTLIKKENKFFLIYQEIQSGAVAKSCIRKGFLICEKMQKYFPIFEEAVSYIWHCNCSILNFLKYEENLNFFFISAIYFEVVKKFIWFWVISAVATAITEPCSENFTVRSRFQPAPAGSSQLQPVPASSSRFQPVPASSSRFQPAPAGSSQLQPVPASSRRKLQLMLLNK